MVTLNSIDLCLSERLKDIEYRREWFRAELEAKVPELFRDLRELRGWTQAELADKSEMKQSAISRFEVSTDAVWKLETLLKLADALDAQLSISLEPSERVLERYARELTPGAASAVSALNSILEPVSSNRSLAANTALGSGTHWAVRDRSSSEKQHQRQKKNQTRLVEEDHQWS